MSGAWSWGGGLTSRRLCDSQTRSYDTAFDLQSSHRLGSISCSVLLGRLARHRRKEGAAHLIHKARRSPPGREAAVAAAWVAEEHRASASTSSEKGGGVVVDICRAAFRSGGGV